MDNTTVKTQNVSDAATRPMTSVVQRLRHGIVNSYLVGEPGGAGTWVLVDAGLAPWAAQKIRAAAADRFGPNNRPAAIILTHGHFDHIGAVKPLAEFWNVPVYAHVLEHPYLTGQSDYPPPDPTVGGGLMARLSRLYPRGPIQLGDRVRALPEDGVVPGLPGWRWLHTPGHSPGHISLFRMSDRVLIAGDAFVTVKQESLWAVMRQRPEVHGPPAYFTPDWELAKISLRSLTDLEPEYAFTGHGVPMSGPALRLGLQNLLEHYESLVRPAHGRYVGHPAITDTRGVISVPPPVNDPFPKTVALGTAAVIAVILMIRSRRNRHRTEM